MWIISNRMKIQLFSAFIALVPWITINENLSVKLPIKNGYRLHEADLDD